MHKFWMLANAGLIEKKFDKILLCIFIRNQHDEMLLKKTRISNEMMIHLSHIFFFGNKRDDHIDERYPIFVYEKFVMEFLY